MGKDQYGEFLALFDRKLTSILASSFLFGLIPEFPCNIIQSMLL